MRAKISAGMSGHPCPPGTRAKIGAKSRGRRHTEETREKMRLAKLGRVPGNRAGKKASDETRRKISVATTGDQNAKWRGGRGDTRYCRDWRTIRRDIRARDGFICQHPGCNKPELGRPHPVHHIDYERDHNERENLITLCVRHHGLTTNGDHPHWTNFYQQLQIRRTNWQA
jgi:hypothetical protein